MRFDKKKLKRPDPKAMEKFIFGATADAGIAPKKEGKGKPVEPAAPGPKKGKKPPKKVVKPAAAPVKPPAPVKRPEVKTPPPEPARPPEPPAAPPEPMPPVAPPIVEGPLVLQNDVKSGITLSLYHNLFKAFKARCREEGRTPSDLFNKFMSDYLGG